MSEMVQTIQIELSRTAILQGLKYKLMLRLTGHLQGMFYDLKTQLVQFTDGK